LVWEDKEDTLADLYNTFLSAIQFIRE